MANKVSVKTKASISENEKTKKQEVDLKAVKQKQASATKKAQETRLKNAKALEEKKLQEAKKLEEEKKEEEAKTKEQSQEIINLGKTILNNRKQKGFLKGLLLGVVIGLALGVFVSTSFIKSVDNTIDTAKESADAILDETFLGYTAADFKNVILGKAIEKQELIVMEQPLTIETTITKAGLGNLEIFSKVKEASFAGYGQYTVNLSDIDEDHIKVDEENKEVTIYIPHAKLYEVVADFENTTFKDTEKGLLAFGDLSLTLEDQNELEQSVENAMEEELSKQEHLGKADELALTKTWEIFEPLVSSISEEYITKVEFSE